ncbi:MAG: hypothetical protein GY821_03940 [Gammaproteobacteria bacterium]|nr:hypothetical protein [Gammaproteobacteria bacterium]
MSIRRLTDPTSWVNLKREFLLRLPMQAQMNDHHIANLGNTAANCAVVYAHRYYAQ